MGFRFHRSIHLGGGIRLNLSKKGVGISTGIPGLRAGIGPRGVSTTVGIPGTGMSYHKEWSLKNFRPARQKRQHLKQADKQVDKQTKLQVAQHEVEVYENRIELLLSVHKECAESIDWKAASQSQPPFVLGEKGPCEKEAEAELLAYKPSVAEKLFKKKREAKLRELKQEIKEAKEADQFIYQEWQRVVATAKKILAGDTDAYLEMVNKEDPLSDIEELGCELKFAMHPDMVEVELFNPPQDLVPHEIKSLTKRGKVSVKEMPKGKYYEIYQDFVCGCVLRIGREMFALLPVNQVLVHVYVKELNTATGHQEEVVVLSVKLTRDALTSINFDQIDCSDAIEAFHPHMNFKKASGFSPVEKYT